MANAIFAVFRKGDSEDPLADVKAIALWMEGQPANDHLGILEAMVRVLEDMGAQQRRVTSKRVLAMLELDRLSLPIQARLRQQFLQPSLSDSVRQRLWHASDDLARSFAYTYENLFGGLQEFSRSRKAKRQLSGVAARMFCHRGEQAKNTLFRYERWIPGCTPRRSVEVPAREYGERRRFVMLCNSRAYTIEFTTALERTKEWAWSEVDIVPQAQ